MKTALMNIYIYKIAEYLLLPLMLINLTVAENRWTVFGLRPDQFIYAATIGLAWYVGYLSRYRHLVTVMLIFAVVFRLLEAFGGGEAFRQMGFGSLAIIFVVAGALIYGRNPFLLHKQLVVYLAICIPIMLLQMLGVSSLLMGWNIGYAHDPSVLSLDEIGSFKEVPLYPTLFVGIEDIVYTGGQGRPVGLMYGSNPLSIFVSIAVAINLAIARTSRIRFSDIVVTLAIVLTMSKLVFGIAIILYLWFLVFGALERRLLVMKLVALVAIGMFLYYILFPGLFISNFSEDIVISSIMLRLVDLLKALGLYDSFDAFGQLSDLSYVYRLSNVYEVTEGYSAVATLLRSKLLVPSLFVMMTGSILYVCRVGNMISRQAMVYVVTLVACILTQFGVPFVKASSFQLIMGFALFPLFNGIWSPGAVSRAGGQAKVAECSGKILEV